MYYEIDEFGYVMLPGSDEWRASNAAADNLSKKFPEADARNFVYALHYNDSGPIEPGVKIDDLILIQEGERDEISWIWRVELSTGQDMKLTAGCDYTGWDCQSWCTWEDWTPEVHCSTCSCG